MGIVKGGFQRAIQSGLYLLAFCCAGVILGIYSYFLSVLANRNDSISKADKAVEGISGIAVVYTICATLLTCCLGGITIFAFIAIVIDVCLIGGFIAIAVMTRHGASSCSGTVNTPLGTGASSSGSGYGSDGFGTSSGSNVTYSVTLGHACKLNTAAFAVSLIGALLFFCTALMQVALVRHHKKEKRFGPSPANNYTSGTGKKQRRGLFARKNKNTAEKDAELGAVGAGVGAGGLAAKHHHDNRQSHDTSYSGATAGGQNTAGTGLVNDADPTHYNTQANSGNQHNTTIGTNIHDGSNLNYPQTGTHGHAPHGSHGGYYTQPQGTGANPYGYENNAPATGTMKNF